MEFLTWLSFLGIAILLTIAPGPDILYLLTKSISSGTTSGIRLAAGLSCGAISHTFLVIIGVATLLQTSPIALRITTIIGASYLIYLAWCSYRQPPITFSVKTLPAEDTRILFRRGFFMNALNPKVLLFFLALLPQFITLDGTLSPVMQIGLLGLTFSVQAFFTFSAVALGAGRLRTLLITKKKFPRLMQRVETGLLTVLAIGLLWS